MSVDQHHIFHEWLHLDDDGELGASERLRLRRHLETCAACRRERQAIQRLHRLLSASAVPVRPGFRREVMEGLGPAGWEARHPRGWLTAAVVFLLLAGGGGAATLLGGGGDGAPWLAAVGAVVELFRTAALAGAGLLAASWHGVGGSLRGALGGSVVPLAVFGLLILGLDLLFVRLLLRSRARRRATAEGLDSPAAADRRREH